MNERKRSRLRFRQFGSSQEAVNLNAASLQTQEREAVASLLPVSMHTGQIILLTKLPRLIFISKILQGMCRCSALSPGSS